MFSGLPIWLTEVDTETAQRRLEPHMERIVRRALREGQSRLEREIRSAAADLGADSDPRALARTLSARVIANLQSRRQPAAGDTITMTAAERYG